MNSPKTQARAAHNMLTSQFRPMYLDVQSLLEMTPEVEPTISFSVKKPSHSVQQYTGTFPLGQASVYRSIFNHWMLDKAGRQFRQHRVNKIIGTYYITNTVTGSVYIGSTDDFYRRWNSHAHHLIAGRATNGHLQKEFNEYGMDAFTITLKTTYQTTDGLLGHEERLGMSFDQALVLNCRLGNKWKSGAIINSGANRTRVHKYRGPNSVQRWFDDARAA
jgi:hypothetical protein